jgi:uncharacterized protein (DUF952 family)
MLVFHIATRDDWLRARREGAYTTSTRGHSLAEEGFIHAARREQVPTVFERYYRGCGEPLVLLTIDTDRLAVPWAEEPVGRETYPHIHGPLDPDAVRHVVPLDHEGRPPSLLSLFARGVSARMGLGLLVMGLAVLGMVLGGLRDPDQGPFLGALAGLAVGGAVTAAVVVQHRRRSPYR